MKYVANPVEVDAFKIVDTGPLHMLGAERDYMDLELENGDKVRADSGMLARFVPAVGDYWVVQADGYTYLNPSDVFERKYSPLVNLGAAVRQAGLQGA